MDSRCEAPQCERPTVVSRCRKHKDNQTVGEFEETACRECGCTDSVPCDGGCLWVEPDLCSKCSDEELEQKEGDSTGN